MALTHRRAADTTSTAMVCYARSFPKTAYAVTEVTLHVVFRAQGLQEGHEIGAGDADNALPGEAIGR